MQIFYSYTNFLIALYQIFIVVGKTFGGRCMLLGLHYGRGPGLTCSFEKQAIVS